MVFLLHAFDISCSYTLIFDCISSVEDYKEPRLRMIPSRKASAADRICQQTDTPLLNISASSFPDHSASINESPKLVWGKQAYDIYF